MTTETEPEQTALTAEATEPPARRFRTFDAIIDFPEFRWYLLSMIANWSALQMQQVVRGYLAYEITGSFAALGGVALANSVPRLLLALSGGVVADRTSRRYIIQVGQVVSALLTLGIALLLFAGQLRLSHLMIAALIQGISNSFTQPARQAMIPDIVGVDRLTNAFGLNTSGMNTMRLIAPAVAGFLIAMIGSGWVYVLMTFMYTLGVITMFRVRARRPASDRGPRARRGPGLVEVVEGFRYVRSRRVLMMLLSVHLFIVLFSMPYQRLLPGFVDEVLSSNSDETAIRLGLLLTFTGLGALAGSLVIASLPNRNRGRILIGSLVVFGFALLAFSISGMFWLSAAIVVVLGLGQAGRQSLSQILIQTHVDNEYRGRVSSIMMMEMGLESFGTFGIAIFATAVGIQWALGLVAVGVLTVAMIVVLLLPDYRRLQ